MDQDYKYFDETTLHKIELICEADSAVDSADRDFLIQLMTFLEEKKFLTRNQKYHVHRLVEKYQFATLL
jgi:hypothetical protein